MGVKRRRHDAGFKAKVALEAVKQEKTIAQLSGRFGIHANMITRWKKHLLTELPVIFSKQYKKADKKTETLTDELYKQIGQLKVELDWLKKKSELLCRREKEAYGTGKQADVDSATMRAFIADKVGILL